MSTEAGEVHTQLRMLVVWQPNSLDSSLGVRPLRTSSTIWVRKAGAQGDFGLGMWNSYFQLESVREMGSTSLVNSAFWRWIGQAEPYCGRGAGFNVG